MFTIWPPFFSRIFSMRLILHDVHDTLANICDIWLTGPEVNATHRRLCRHRGADAPKNKLSQNTEPEIRNPHGLKKDVFGGRNHGFFFCFGMMGMVQKNQIEKHMKFRIMVWVGSTPQTSNRVVTGHSVGVGSKVWYNNTVDGKNPAPLGMYKTLKTMGYLPYQLVQDFFHQHYDMKKWPKWLHVNSRNAGTLRTVSFFSGTWLASFFPYKFK